ncbi:MAG: hypothetical protein JXB26_08735 [Candidatus Aminicenantes bacterium]|nr:hypothetical protein [Candidatus Aminicenantes bacterium]
MEKIETLNRIIKAKEERRKELSNLPFREKIKILVRLQKLAAGVHRPGKKQRFDPWSI